MLDNKEIVLIGGVTKVPITVGPLTIDRSSLVVQKTLLSSHFMSVDKDDASLTTF